MVSIQALYANFVEDIITGGVALNLNKVIEILDAVIAEVGHLNSQEIIDKMHDEEAYKCTEKNGIIPFSHAAKLSIH